MSFKSILAQLARASSIAAIQAVLDTNLVKLEPNSQRSPVKRKRKVATKKTTTK